jgi:smad nuclear-interacting protein 1
MARDLSPFSARRLLTQQLAAGRNGASHRSENGSQSHGPPVKNEPEPARKEPSAIPDRRPRSRSGERRPGETSTDREARAVPPAATAIDRACEVSPEPYRKPRASPTERKRDRSPERRRDRSRDRRRDRSRDSKRDRVVERKRSRSRDRRRERSKDGRRDRSRDKDSARDRRRDRSEDRHSRRHRSRSKDRRRKDRSKERRRSRSPLPDRSRKPRKRSASASPAPKRRRHTGSQSGARSPSPHQRTKKPLPSQDVSFRGLDDSVQPPSKYGGAPANIEKPNFKTTGALAKHANRVEGTKISLKYHEPPEARKPSPSQPWRIFVFKGDDVVDTLEIWQKSCWLLGRSYEVVDYVLEHPSSSGQHAAIQFRYIQKTVEDDFGVKSNRGKVKPYIIDLDSSNGTELNGETVEASRYHELRDKDILKFAGSEREYVVMLPPPEKK